MFASLFTRKVRQTETPAHVYPPVEHRVMRQDHTGMGVCLAQATTLEDALVAAKAIKAHYPTGSLVPRNLVYVASRVPNSYAWEISYV